MFIAHQNVPILHNSFPYFEAGRGIFLGKNEYFMDLPFLKFIFPKMSRTSANQF